MTIDLSWLPVKVSNSTDRFIIHIVSDNYVKVVATKGQESFQHVVCPRPNKHPFAFFVK